MQDPKLRTENDTVAELAKEASMLPIQIEVTKPQVLLKRDGSTINLERYLPEPTRPRAKVDLTEPASFINYVTTHGDSGTQLSGTTSLANGSFTAILDYHYDQTMPAEARARWGDHTAVLTMAPTPEWIRWYSANNKQISQSEFAEFLEDNIADIIRPSGAELLEIALTLQAAKAVNFRSAVRLANGQHQIRYEETINAQAGTAGSMEIPERFAIRLAPFEGVEPVEIAARLRYRINEGRLTFSYRLDNPDRMVREQWQKIREAIEKATAKPVHRGSATIVDPKP